MNYAILTCFSFWLVLVSALIPNPAWLKKETHSYTLHYTSADLSSIDAYQKAIDNGLRGVEQFFDRPFKSKFDVVIYPDRKMLDSVWRKDWNMPDFKSECWMVASGVAKKIDIISPRMWDMESCEHKYSDTVQTQRLISHEMVHVFHGQLNVSPDFSDVENIDWFVEGLATYASGQCDEKRLAEVKKSIEDKTAPSVLDKFWTGKMKYGLSGSMVMFIDHKHGRAKLLQLMPYNKLKQILDRLGTTEDELISGWTKYMEGMELRK